MNKYLDYIISFILDLLIIIWKALKRFNKLSFGKQLIIIVIILLVFDNLREWAFVKIIETWLWVIK